MSVKIRLAPVGKKNQISYRIVAQDTRGKLTGKFLEILGFYNPFNKPSFKVNTERLTFWTQKGAVTSATVAKLLKDKTVDNQPLP